MAKIIANSLLISTAFYIKAVFNQLSAG